MATIQQDPLDFLPLPKSQSSEACSSRKRPAAESGEELDLPGPDEHQRPAKRAHRVPFEWREDGRLDEIRKEMIGLL